MTAADWGPVGGRLAAGGPKDWRLHVVALAGARDPAPLARAWGRRRDLAWLDSSQGHPRRARFSALCQVGPTALAHGRSCRRRDAESDFAGRARHAFGRGRVGRGAALRDAPACPFLGGWLGYLAYEAQIDMDPAFPGRSVDLPYPRVWFREALRGVTVAHGEDRSWLWAWTRPGEAPPDLGAWERCLDGLGDARGLDGAPVGWSVSPEVLSRAWYEEAVSDVLGRIAAGEVYQVNLTAPVTVRAGADPLGVYLRLRRASPGDFAAFLDWPGLTVLASSPEEFVTLRGRRAVARPMKGTRARAADPAADAAAERSLAESPKDRAENVMIVDLIRNDLGRVAEVGGVSVTELFEVETYATVHQLTSRVEARLREGEDVFGLLAALFPPGSMTGTPKVQATRVIRALEPEPRGLYSGCLGAIDWRGDAVFNVVIRSLVAHPWGASWSVGGGIVADSEPASEYAEARVKLEGLLRGLAVEARFARG